ncbi:hypothetical protein [Kribbella swartbergensis]
MEFDEFDGEYRRVLEAVRGGAGAEEVRPEIERLRRLSRELTDPADRADGGHDLRMLEDLLAAPSAVPASPTLEAANEAYAEAVREDGTPSERIDRVQHGIDRLNQLATQATPDDQTAIHSLNESLHLLLGALGPDATAHPAR